MSVLPTYMYVHHVPSASGGKKRKSDPLKLELERIVDYHLGARNQTPVFSVFWKSSQCFLLLSDLSSPQFYLILININSYMCCAVLTVLELLKEKKSYKPWLFFFFSSCVGVEEEKAADIDLYHCPNCEVLHGPSISK